jgi:hypothetical protein
MDEKDKEQRQITKYNKEKLSYHNQYNNQARGTIIFIPVTASRGIIYDSA